jgi:hypothetical protein
MYEKFIAPVESSLPHTVFERLEMICGHKKYSAIATEKEVFINLDKLNCTLQKIPNAYIGGAVSFAIQKRSPYKRILKHT